MGEWLDKKGEGQVGLPAACPAETECSCQTRTKQKELNNMSGQKGSRIENCLVSTQVIEGVLKILVDTCYY